MENDNDTLESGGWLSGSAEAPSEKSEKQRESAKKAQSQLQKTQKDEKKAKSDNDDLFLILSKFIQNPLYEELIPSIALLLEKGVPSRFILVITALIYPEATLHVFVKIWKHEEIKKMKHIHRYETMIPFHEKDLDISIRDWISFWMVFSKEFLIQDSGSTILDMKLIDILSTKDRHIIRQTFWVFFQFFFREKNVDIPYNKADTYGEFIVWEFEKEIVRKLETSDVDLKNSQKVDPNMLF